MTLMVADAVPLTTALDVNAPPLVLQIHAAVVNEPEPTDLMTAPMEKLRVVIRAMTASVVRVSTALDKAGALHVVDDGDHVARIEPQVSRDATLRGRAVLHQAGKHSVVLDADTRGSHRLGHQPAGQESDL